MSHVLEAGVLWNMGKSSDIRNVIVGRPDVISQRKNAQKCLLTEALCKGTIFLNQIVRMDLS